MSDAANLDRVYRYHDGTKHHFDRFARSLGYLDWASQPRPFRAYADAPVVELERRAPTGHLAAVTYDALFAHARVAAPITLPAVGDMLRHALGLSAWKVLGSSRWPLRVNPSSGNLHPTEAYVITGPLPDRPTEANVWHYAADRHALEQRCAFPPAGWPFAAGEEDAFLIALTSIHWRESWKYGERGFRYCQHDLGHAIGALSIAAAMSGWTVTVQSACSHDWIAALTGIDRDQDYVEAEREEAGCLLLISKDPVVPRLTSANPLAAVVRDGRWFGRASQLSEDHVQWTFIDEVAAATRDPGHPRSGTGAEERGAPTVTPATDPRPIAARTIVLQRRSAVAFDGLSTLDADTFFRMLVRMLPHTAVPWDTLPWLPSIHLAIFVHRVAGLDAGLYLLVRDDAARSRLVAACNSGFEWQPVDRALPLYRLAKGPFRVHAQRLSCDQSIAGDGFFSLGMIADFGGRLEEYGPSFYRRLFWECGVIGQMLYLEAEAAGVRGTGIGCFYDDAVHDTLGLTGHAFQSLYHFTVGVPVEDRRLTTESGYAWER